MPVIIPNAWISSTRKGGAPIYGGPGQIPRFVQLDDESVAADAGLVEIQAGSSSAMAPLLNKTIYDDLPDANYQRNDIIVVLAGTEQIQAPIANPYHVIRVLAPYGPLGAHEVRMTRIDHLMQAAWLYTRIQPDTPNAVPTGDWDPIRKFEQTFTDGTQGVGLGLRDPASGLITALGYLDPVLITVGINEYAIDEQNTEDGQLFYEAPVALFEDPVVMRKGDVLITDDNRRLRVADVVHRVQRVGVILGTLARLEEPGHGDLIWSWNAPDFPSTC